MDISLRNRKVAVSRWRKVLEKERLNIKNDADSMRKRAAICGFLAGDGSVQVRKDKTFYHYQIDFFPDDILMLNAYIDFLYAVYNKRPSIKEQHKFYTVRINSKTLALDLLKYSKFGLSNWRLPRNLFNIIDADKYWLRAFFSAEGTVNERGIRVQTINEKGMLEVSQLLNKLGVSHKIYYYTPKKYSEKKVTILIISNIISIGLFYNEIGFWHSKKQKILKQLLDSKIDAVVAQSGTAQIL